MKLITWNCNMAFRKKAAAILAHQPDILVVPECEHPDRLRFPPGTTLPTDTLWFGTNPSKGLGIFSYGRYRLQLLDTHNPDFKTVLPIAVTGGSFQFTLYAIWANNPHDKNAQYIGQVWKALHHYGDALTRTPAMLAGDFNSNTIWDRKSRQGNHSQVVEYLADRGIISAYHAYHRQTQGREAHPTFYLYRHLNKPYHLDYCFVSLEMAKYLKEVTVGDHEAWKTHSDHVPLLVHFRKPRKAKTQSAT